MLSSRLYTESISVTVVKMFACGVGENFSNGYSNSSHNEAQTSASFGFLVF
jgi:hypothetical protein